jgi:hypothetical protein
MMGTSAFKIFIVVVEGLTHSKLRVIYKGQGREALGVCPKGCG